MPSPSSRLSREAILARYFPCYRLAALPAYAGLSGASCVIIGPRDKRLVLRQHHDASAAEYHFRRQYRALRSLPADLAPQPIAYFAGWMAIEYLQGEVTPALPTVSKLAGLLVRLHRQRCFGWRVALLPLLEHYWQRCDPGRRFPHWLRRLKRLRKQGEPRPLRLAPLHMDVHAGNIINSSGELRLIDWEYAGDGDIALELAGVWMPDEIQRQALVGEYAVRANISPALLAKHVRRWRPWMLMLAAGWYEYRWAQTGDRQFIALADDSWRQLNVKK